MASLIKIKRSSGSAAPGSLSAGELAYSFGSGTQADGGDRLYFGTGTAIEVIGGKYFTAMLDHVPGKLTDSSALVVDANSKLDNLKVDNLDLKGNTISSTDANGNIVLDPNGNGKVEFALANNSAAYATVTGPTATQYKDNIIAAADDNAIPNKKYVDDAITATGSGALTIKSPDGTSTEATLNFATEDLEFDGVGGIEFTVSEVTDGAGPATKVKVTATLTQNLDPSASVDFARIEVDNTLILDNNTVSTTDGDLTLTAGGTGNVVANRLEVTDLTETRVVFVGAGDQLVDDANFTFNSSTDTLTVNGAVQVDNLNLNGNTISSTDTAGDINISPIVNGDVNIATTGTADINLTVAAGREVVASTLAVSDLTASRLVATSTNGALVTDDDLTFDGTNLNLTGVFNVDNVRIDGNTISSTNTDGNIVLDPNGTGVVDVSNTRITNLADPTSPQDAATKQYVDNVAEGLHIHQGVDAATTDTLATISGGTVTYNNGTLGVGATLTTTGTYTTIDGYELNNGDRVLVKNETTKAHNGIYTVTSSTVLTRATDYDTDAEIAGGDFVFVTNGTLYDSTGWVQIDPVNTVGTDPIEWEQFSGAGTYTAGDGLLLTGTVFSVNVDNSTIEISSDTLRVKDAGITNAKLANSTITVAADSGTADPVALGETLTFTGTDPVQTTVTGNTITISVDDATTTTKGIASFNADDFDVTTGAVSLEDTVLKSITTDTGALTIAGHAVSILGGEGMDVTHSGTTITVAGEDATTTNKGIASFADANFTVTAGAVAAKTITLGSSSLSLGGTTTAIAGLTQLTVENLDFNGNTITSTGNLVVDVSTDVVDFSGAKLTNIIAPTADTDAATKKYVDDTIANNAVLTIDGDSTTADVKLSTDDLQIVAAPNLGLTSAVAKVGTDVTLTLTLAQDIRTTASPSFVGLTLSGDAAVNGGDLTTTATTFNLVNTNATTVNFAGAATSLTVGATTGITAIRNSATVGGDLTVAGDLIVNGTTTTVNTVNLVVEDSLIKLADGNTANSLDIGFYGQFNTNSFTGLFRDANDSNKYKLFATGTVADNVVTVTTLADLVVGTLEGTIDGGTY